MEYKAKSIIVSRNKDRRRGASPEFPYFVMVKLFNVNDPHKTTRVPRQTLEFVKVKNVVFRNKDVKYLPLGSDIVINDLNTFKVRQKDGELVIE